MYWGRDVEKLGAESDRKESDSGDCNWGRIRHWDRRRPREVSTNADVKSTLASAYFADTSLEFGRWVKIGAAFTLQSTFSTWTWDKSKWGQQPLLALWTLLGLNLKGQSLKWEGKFFFCICVYKNKLSFWFKGSSPSLSQALSLFPPFTDSPYHHHHNRQLDPIYLLLSDVLDRFSAFSAQFWVEPTFWVVALLPCCPVMMAPHSSCPSRYPPVKTRAAHQKGCSLLLETETLGNQTSEGFLDHSSFIKNIVVYNFAFLKLHQITVKG